MKPMLLLLFGLILIVLVKSQTLSDVKRLYNDTFTNYKKEIIPSDPTVPLVVHITFYLAAIVSVKEVDQSMVLIGSFGVVWKDSSMVWDPSLYGYLYSITIDPKDLWLPPIFISNRIDAMESIGAGSTFSSSVLYNGTIYYSPGDVFEAACTIDVSKFPFDTQACTLEIMTWGITKSYLTFNDPTGSINLEYFHSNADWTLVYQKTYVVDYNHYKAYFVDIKLKRQPMYYVTMVVIPTLLFAILNPLVFILPVDSGERIGLAMTILLSYAIFLTLVSASIPTTSNPMCVLLIIMIVTIVNSGIIVILTITNSRYYHMENTDNVWTSVKRVTRWHLKRNNTVKPMEDKARISVSGKDISDLIDKICFVLSYVIICFVTCGYIGYIAY